ncbi:MAG: autotransporter assembly complex family protein [Pseudomonadota bacterium]|nr:autotransporter assembly complex family protein [Pseudomonadota bacterium]
MKQLVPCLLALSCMLSPGIGSAATRVQIEGLSGDLADNARAALALQSAVESGMDHPGTLRRLYRQGDEEIAKALQPYGYYTPQIESRLDGDFPDAVATFRVSPGGRTTVSTVDMKVEGEGQDDELLQALIKRFPLKPGDPLVHAPYETFKQQFAQAAYGRGYIDAELTRREIRINPVTQQAEILLTLKTGRRFRFGEVRIEQDILRDEVVRRYVPIVPGEWFDPQVLLDTQFALSDLDYYATVDVQPLRQQATDDRVPVLIHAEARPRTRYDYGIGYGTDTGARLSAGIDRRWLNDRGHKLESDLQLSEIKNVIGTEYSLPLGTKAGEKLSFPAAYTEEQFETGNSTKYSVGASLSRIPGDWQRRLYLNFEHEEFDSGESLESTNLLMPGVALNRSELNDEIYPTRGWYFFVDTHGAHESVISDTSFVQASTLTRGVFPLGEHTRFLARVEYGATWVDDFGVLPSSQRFFAGGDQSVRGYGYQSIGPRNEDGDVVGGRYLATASAEVERLIWGNIGLAAFYDIGGADNNALPTLYSGVGLGFRYRSPIGIIRLDLAHPLDGDSSGIRIHFGIRVGL